MSRNGLLATLASTLIHGGAAAVLLATATVPHGQPVQQLEPHAVSIDLIDASQMDAGAEAPAAASTEAAATLTEIGDVTPSGAPGPRATASATAAGDSAPAQASAPDPGAVSDYYLRLESHLARFHRYPQTSLSPRPSGMVRVALIVRRDGHLMDAWIETSSGVVMLDEAALQTLRKAEPLPVLPATLPGAIDLIVPLKYAVGARTAG